MKISRRRSASGRYDGHNKRLIVDIATWHAIWNPKLSKAELRELLHQAVTSTGAGECTPSSSKPKTSGNG